MAGKVPVACIKCAEGHAYCGRHIAAGDHVFIDAAYAACPECAERYRNEAVAVEMHPMFAMGLKR